MARTAVQLYDHRGRKLRATGAGAYWGSGTGRRAAHWYPSSESINSILANNMSSLRARARDMMRKSPWASTALDRFTDSAVGTGIRPLPLIQDAGQRGEVIDSFEHWAEQEADADGRTSFYGLQEIACREIREVGEVFARLRARSLEDGMSVPLQVQILESEQCDETFTQVLSTQREVKLGIEFDRLGRRRAYHMYSRHPGDVNFPFGRSSVIDRKPVPADNVLHVFEVLRAGQVRGIPPIVVLLAKFKDVTETDDAFIVKQKVAALFTAFVTKPTEEANPLGAMEGPDGDQEPQLLSMEPGLMQELLPGEDVKFATPPEGTRDYVTWFRDQLRTLCAGMGVMYEHSVGDYSTVNYSSIRAGLIFHRRAIQRWQHNVLIRQFCAPVFRRWYADGILSGELSEDPKSRDGIPRVKWIPTPGWAQVDPDKETRSNERQIRSGQLTRTQLQIENAIDPEEFDQERQRENERADKLKLIYDSDPRLTNQTGSLQGAAAPKPTPTTGTTAPGKAPPTKSTPKGAA